MSSSRTLTQLRSKEFASLLSHNNWHEKWSSAIVKSRHFFARLSRYIHDHPYIFTLQVLAGFTCLTAVTTLPILAVVGFSAAGPVAGSAAAAWQASLGVVEAGTLFAWCQSVAMGGTALATVVGTGVLGGIAVTVPAVTPDVIKTAMEKAKDVGCHVGEKLRAMKWWS